MSTARIQCIWQNLAENCSRNVQEVKIYEGKDYRNLNKIQIYLNFPACYLQSCRAVLDNFHYDIQKCSTVHYKSLTILSVFNSTDNLLQVMQQLDVSWQKYVSPLSVYLDNRNTFWFNLQDFVQRFVSDNYISPVGLSAKKQMNLGWLRRTNFVVWFVVLRRARVANATPLTDVVVVCKFISASTKYDNFCHTV